MVREGVPAEHRHMTCTHTDIKRAFLLFLLLLLLFLLLLHQGHKFPSKKEEEEVEARNYKREGIPKVLFFFFFSPPSPNSPHLFKGLFWKDIVDDVSGERPQDGQQGCLTGYLFFLASGSGKNAIVTNFVTPLYFEQQV